MAKLPDPVKMIDTLRAVVRFKPLELDAVERRLSRAANVDDYRRIAKRRLPGGVFDYIDGGAEDEIALDRNSRAFSDVEFRPRVLRNVDVVDPSTTLFGTPMPMPLIFAPTGFTRIAHPEGELAVGRATAAAGIPYGLSSLGTQTIEDLGAAAHGVSSDARLWFQVYVWKDRGLVRSLIERAKAANYEAICITVDTAVLGRRERDVRRGYTLPPKLGLDTIIDGIRHPAWTWEFVNSDPIMFANIVGTSVGDGSDAISLAEYAMAQFDQSLSWDDIEWMRTIWDGPIVLKGIQTVEDARIGVDMGIEGIALSNHGGRQLDSAPAIFELIEPVAQEIGGEAAILCDGGVRRGSDIVKALCMGATAVMAGRPYLYALGAGGQRGVEHLIDFFSAGMHQTMALCGARNVDELTRDLVTRAGQHFVGQQPPTANGSLGNPLRPEFVL